MKPYIAFHDGEVFIELENWLNSNHVPVGAFVRYKHPDHVEINWYVVMANGNDDALRNAMGINEADVPPWVRGYLLIL